MKTIIASIVLLHSVFISATILKENESEASSPIVTVTPIPSICYDMASGSAEINITGGSLPYTLSLSGPTTGTKVVGTDSRLSNLSAGNYQLTVTDADASSTIVDFVIEQPSKISFWTDVTHPTCSGDDGVIFVDPIVGGVAPYTILCTGIEQNWYNLVEMTDLAEGTYTIAVTDENGCIATKTVTLVQDPYPVIYGPNTTCLNEIELHVTPIFSNGYWTVVGGSGTLSNPTHSTVTITNMAYGVNTFAYTVINGTNTCTTIYPVAYMGVSAEAGVDKTICGNSTTLAANLPLHAIGQWLGSGTFLDQNDPHTIVAGLSHGPNELIWQVYNQGCISSDTVIIINDMPYPVHAGTDKITMDHYVYMNAEPLVNGVGNWQVVSGSGSIQNPNNCLSQVENLAYGPTVLRWQASTEHCNDYDEVVVTRYRITNAGLDKATCADTVTMRADNPVEGVGEWSVVSGSGIFEQQNSPYSRVSGLSPGTNTFKWTVTSNGVSRSDNVNITNNAPSVSYAGPDQNILINETQLQASTPIIGVGEWSLLSGRATFDDIWHPNTAVRNLWPGTNKLRFTVMNNGCSSYDDVQITVDSPTSTGALNEDALVEIYPNPVKNHLTINNLSVNSLVYYSLFNVAGVRVLSGHLNGKNKITIALPQLKKGTYFMHIITDNNQTLVKKLIVE